MPPRLFHVKHFALHSEIVLAGFLCPLFYDVSYMQFDFIAICHWHMDFQSHKILHLTNP